MADGSACAPDLQWQGSGHQRKLCAHCSVGIDSLVQAPLAMLSILAENVGGSWDLSNQFVRTHEGQVRVPTYDGFEPASAKASASMRRVRGRDTSLELALRRALWKRGLRYRLHVASLPGTPDIVFPTERIAVFCDGDFWHGRDWPSRRDKLARGSNPDYWIPKIKANRRRDRRVDRLLAALQWRGVRVWESEMRREPERVANRIARVLARARQNQR